MRSPDSTQVDHAINEILLRIERIRFEPFYLVEPNGIPERSRGSSDQHPFANIAAICDYIAGNFRQDIDCADIATSVDIHPKYAMSLFKKSTGVTLNEYVNLLRLSYAQALLMKEDSSILTVASESGFGSLSNFNKCFRRIAGMSPTDFRRDVREQAEPRALSVDVDILGVDLNRSLEKPACIVRGPRASPARRPPRMPFLPLPCQRYRLLQRHTAFGIEQVHVVHVGLKRDARAGRRSCLRRDTADDLPLPDFAENQRVGAKRLGDLDFKREWRERTAVLLGPGVRQMLRAKAERDFGPACLP